MNVGFQSINLVFVKRIDLACIGLVFRYMRITVGICVGTCRRIVRISLLLTGLVLIVLGILNGGLRDVLIKAVNICTECIGLG